MEESKFQKAVLTFRTRKNMESMEPEQIIPKSWSQVVEEEEGVNNVL